MNETELRRECLSKGVRRGGVATRKLLGFKTYVWL